MPRYNPLMSSPAELFRLDDLPGDLQGILQVEKVWQVLERLDRFGAEIESRVEGRVHPSAIIGDGVYIAPGAEVGPYALIEGPAWLGEGSVVGHGAFLRGPVVLSPGARVGHASEVKRSVFLPSAKAPHFNYVGDSIIGREANLGAGVKIANFKTFGDEIRMNGVETGLRKLGAAVGDYVSIGCNAVLSPGTVIGARSVVYNGAMVRGTVPADSIVKTRYDHEIASRKPKTKLA